MRMSCMHKIKRNTRGAALMIALLVFLIAALSGTIALTMAASNAGRYTHEKDDQQAYLSVISAGNLILDRLEGLTIVYTGTVIGESPTEAGEVDILFEVEKSKENLFLTDEGFKNNLKQFSLKKSKWDPMEFTLKASEDSGMGEVCVSIYVIGSVFYFRLYHQSGAAKNYQMTLQVECNGSGDSYQGSPTDYWKKNMTFATERAKYTVENNVPSGGTGE